MHPKTLKPFEAQVSNGNIEKHQARYYQPHVGGTQQCECRHDARAVCTTHCIVVRTMTHLRGCAVAPAQHFPRNQSVIYMRNTRRRCVATFRNTYFPLLNTFHRKRNKCCCGAFCTEADVLFVAYNSIDPRIKNNLRLRT